MTRAGLRIQREIERRARFWQDSAKMEDVCVCADKCEYEM